MKVDLIDHMGSDLMEQSDELVVKSLQNYYDICSKPDKIDCSDDIIEPDEDLLWAIRRVLEEYMGRDEYKEWVEKGKGG